MVNKKIKTVKEDKVRNELEVVKGMLARALADYDNLAKRVDRERVELGKIASVGVIVKFLPVLDNLERSQEHIKDSGLAIAIGELINVLKDEGFTVISPSIGDEFNENTMEAIEVVTGERDNMVTEVVLSGWKYEDPVKDGAGGSVVRHAKVKVSKKNN
jgi:molecular chaperone GrpE